MGGGGGGGVGTTSPSARMGEGHKPAKEVVDGGGGVWRVCGDGDGDRAALLLPTSCQLQP